MSMRQDLNATLGKVVTGALISVTLAISPNLTLDPFNPIKMLLLSGLAFLGLGILVFNRRGASFKNYRMPLIVVSAFSLWLLVVFLLSGGEKLQQLFGVNGRNTGLITYLAFVIFFVISLFVSSPTFTANFLKASLIAGSMSLLYGLIQIIDADPFPWQEIYSPVFGFLGNPNFQSSLLGILGVIIFTQLLSQSISIKIKLPYFAYLLISVYVIFETGSQQGFLVFLFGCATSVGIFIFKQNLKMGYAYLLMGSFGFLGILFGILNKGPFASILYKDSVTYRGDYWRAGWNMTLENPILGVGLDGYGDWYRRSRTLEATLRRGPDVVSNAAHNVYLDISSNGGFPLLAAYLALSILVVVSVIKVLSREKRFNSGFVALFAGWVAFQAQSIISINQIGLAIWGWVLAGLIIGYEINTRENVSTVIDSRKVGSRKTPQTETTSVLGMIVGLVVGLAIAIPPCVASAQFNSALKQTDIVSVVQAASIWPYEPSRMIQVASTLDQNNLGSKGLEVILDATKKFPDSFAVWTTLATMNGASEKQKAQALAQMKRLDPLNPNLK